MKREYTLLIDEREKKPFTFPEYMVCLDPSKDPCRQSGITVRIRTQKRTLKTGDYTLDGGAAVVERKGSLNEITQNLLTPDGRRRFADCCRRLRDETARPLLLLEGLVGQPEPKPGKPHPGLAIDSLLRILQEYAIGLIVLPTGTAGQRRAAGEWTARWLITQEHHGIRHPHDRHEELPLRTVHGVGLGTEPDPHRNEAGISDGQHGVRVEPELHQAQDL